MAFIQQCVFSWSLFVRPIPSRNGAVDRHALKNFRARGALSNVEMLFGSAGCKSIRNCKHVPVIYKYNFAGRVRPYDLAAPRKGVKPRIVDSILKWGVVTSRPLMSWTIHHDYRHKIHLSVVTLNMLRNMDVSENSGTPKSSILIGVFHYKTIHFGVPLFLETPIWGNAPNLIGITSEYWPKNYFLCLGRSYLVDLVALAASKPVRILSICMANKTALM